MRPDLYHSFSPLAGVVALLRGLAVANEELCDPRQVFGREYRASLAADGCSFKANTHFGHLSSDEFKAEQEALLAAYKAFWEHEDGTPVEAMSVEGMLARLFVLDGFRAEPTHGARRGAWDEHPLSRTLMEGAYYLHAHKTYPRRGSWRMPLYPASLDPEHVMAVCDQLFAGMEVIPNPLVAVRLLDDAGLAAFGTTQERTQRLRELDGLSGRLWRMAPSVDRDMLMARLMLLPDGGASDLEAIAAHAPLCGSSYRAR